MINLTPNVIVITPTDDINLMPGSSVVDRTTFRDFSY
jgi:hypothetical protein